MSPRKALLRKAAGTDVHAAGFRRKIGGLHPLIPPGFFDSLPSLVNAGPVAQVSGI